MEPLAGPSQTSLSFLSAVVKEELGKYLCRLHLTSSQIAKSGNLFRLRTPQSCSVGHKITVGITSSQGQTPVHDHANPAVGATLSKLVSR